MSDDTVSTQLLRTTEQSRQFAMLFDRWGFMIAFTVGALGIVGLKVALAEVFQDARITQAVVTAFPVSIMIAYATIIYLSPRLRLRDDQAGDNIYYLGFLFTLVSLAYALAIFTPEAGAAQIIGSFGIALVTTITGLGVRVMFNQMRQELVEIERETRLELAEAGTRLRTELDQIALSMNDFRRVTQQAMAEAFLDVNTIVEGTLRNAAEKLVTATDLAAEGLKSSFEGFGAHAGRFADAANAMTESIQKHSSAIESLANGTATLDARIASLVKVSTEAEKGLNALAKKTAQIQALQTSMQSAAESAQKLVVDQTAVIAGLSDSVAGVVRKISAAAADWERDAGLVAQRVTTQSAKVQDQFVIDLERLHGAQTEVLRRFNDGLEKTVRSVHEHGEALAEELAKSRDYTRQVHTALVDMSADLIRKVEAIPYAPPDGQTNPIR